ncbi:lipoprotein signal peptidase [Paraoerskovia sediminicola]|uniref:Lipoprotein signal peptidase n=1 Tax=Paraoerskovia sediminicola TaxID=1138587 RepID=A0ABM8G6R3_9CELL|nr:signal peptidase II [Paraoerskovia sediminicola]BDZ43829.1 lipoprotein signal peptidase [Paraoerskovia sediminicola]
MSTTQNPAEGSARPSAVARRSLILWTLGLAAFVVLLDQVSKVWAEGALAGEPRIALIGDLLGLRLVYNPGAALSFGTGMTWVLTVVVVVVIVLILRTMRRIRSTGWAVALGLLLGGAVGNLIDRLTNDPGFGRGEVVDFIDYGVFVGNVADIAIVLAAGVIVVLAFRGVGVDGTRHGADEATGEADPAAEQATDQVADQGIGQDTTDDERRDA